MILQLPLSFVLRDYPVVSVRRQLIDNRIEDPADSHTDTRADKKQRHIVVSEKLQELMDYRQHSRKVHTREDYRDKEYREHLRIDALFYVFPGHAHFLHYAESRLVFKSLRYLLVVDDKHARDEEYHAQKDA